ncbi:extracellular solute-binding protein family 5 [Halorubrum californiense DSM 19288]|uniref:Extracellular solute-binding protein family 5 n=1 Tax=Halorubrum californiense DSM 19288 TaxID=1227465 RepID=M0E3P4_9EURY|nr:MULTISPECIES: ABC transporter substrate-binding protein [Halorubrum]ELZ41557.1 extracellular solute-binding protein family 5 [Halorubrum californiense DSM 19288]TKX70308.1 ABC transporter substrate-binding protein [Halorubrum sp. GN11GM_10-3_MGM]
MTRPISRRAALAGLGLAAASAGCLGRTENIAGRDPHEQLTLEINTTPADGDPNGIRIARQFEEHLTAVGIDVRLNTVGQTDLWRKVLVNQNFDLYVGQFVETEPFDSDALYGLTHSQFVAEPGWQNPFGFTEIAVDDLLERQRRATGTDRSDAVDALQETVCDRQPFSVVAFPDALTAVRGDRFDGWTQDRQPVSVTGLLGLDAVPDADGSDGSGDGNATDGNATVDAADADEEGGAALQLVTTDARITENWNPIAAEYRKYGTFTGLLYDPLVRTDDRSTVPWLAADWERPGANTLDVALRDARWHDGEPVTASDVAFTYRFLRDTSLGSVETSVPTPRFRGRSSLVEDERVLDDSTVRLTVPDVNETVAARALQVPILPEHVWSERTDAATIAGFELDFETTEAVVSNNADPVGSGPLRFVEATAGESVVFERNPDHFLVRPAPGADSDSSGETADPRAGIPPRYHGKPAFDRIRVEVLPSDISAVESVAGGLADATVSNLGPESVPRIGRSDDTRLVSGQSAAFYHVGYNARRSPLSNPRFRAVIARLIDKSAIVDNTFDGYAQAAASPLAASPDAVPESLAWTDGTDPVHPFFDDGGSLDVEAAREALRDIGYRFDDEGRLLSRGQ